MNQEFGRFLKYVYNLVLSRQNEKERFKYNDFRSLIQSQEFLAQIYQFLESFPSLDKETVERYRHAIEFLSKDDIEKRLQQYSDQMRDKDQIQAKRKVQASGDISGKNIVPSYTNIRIVYFVKDLAVAFPEEWDEWQHWISDMMEDQKRMQSKGMNHRLVSLITSYRLTRFVFHIGIDKVFILATRRATR